MRKLFVLAGSLLCSSLLTTSSFAKEYYVGEPLVKNEMQLVPHYLLGIEMSPMRAGMTMGKDPVHLELDLHAAKGEMHGFKEDEWIPNVRILYTLEKVGNAKFRKSGYLLPMSANDGVHYANNVEFGGSGQYKVTFRLTPPSDNGLYRHVDKETGVPAWWEPFSVDWTFSYPARTASQ